MIEGLYSALESYQGEKERETQPRKIVRMVKNERMAGSVPMWESIKEPPNQFENMLQTSLNKNANIETPGARLTYHESHRQTPDIKTDDFGFGDLFDMLNPLHHVPFLGRIYTEISGDQIKPMGRVIGSALYAGPIGAASALINTVIMEETGKDLMGNAMAMVFESDQTTPKNTHDPEIQLAQATSDQVKTSRDQQNDLPVHLLAFADLKSKPDFVIQRTDAAEGRTAGSFSTKHYHDLSSHPIKMREPITQVRFNQ